MDERAEQSSFIGEFRKSQGRIEQKDSLLGKWQK